VDFIEEAVKRDYEAGQRIVLRYPPEPNGYIHIGHAKAFGISFRMRERYNGTVNLRFDDTNPAKENEVYVESIKRDLEWLGIKYDKLFFASDYYGRLYKFAVYLIGKGLAYVDDSSAEEIGKMRGELGRRGTESKYRGRGAEENLRLFEEMRAGKYEDGSKVLRAKIDMGSPNMNMRDPIMYKISRVRHFRTGDEWVIYPLYDFAHPLSDYLEGVSHSLCSLEFEDHRPLYNWYIENCRGCFAGLPAILPRQYEFSRLNIAGVKLSKRYLKEQVDSGEVDGWDDPRMPTICGMRRRGIPASAIMEFVESIGVSKSNMVIPAEQFEYYIRRHLLPIAEKISVVENVIKLSVANFGEIFIDGSDYSADPPSKYKRLTRDNVVQLFGGPKIRLKEFPNCEITDEKAAGVIQYVMVKSAKRAKIRGIGECLYDGGIEIRDGVHYQFIRKGYYIKDTKADGDLTFIKTIGLKEGY
jgi:glutaminyl-tRNA synthetase